MRAGACLVLGALGLASSVHARSQQQLQDDCLQRLRPIVPREAKTQTIDFSALGSYARYYVVKVQFTAILLHGRRSGVCTYGADGKWVKDDAADYLWVRDAAPRQSAAKQ